MPCHDDPKRGSCKGFQCFLELHNEATFGLARSDCALINKKKEDWVHPSKAVREENARHIEQIQRVVGYNLRRGQAARAVEDSI
jgi:DNA recombination-dependent growth factor C